MLIIPELLVLVLAKRNVGSGNEDSPATVAVTDKVYGRVRLGGLPNFGRAKYKGVRNMS